jgi:hypothetical protein
LGGPVRSNQSSGKQRRWSGFNSGGGNVRDRSATFNTGEDRVSPKSSSKATLSPEMLDADIESVWAQKRISRFVSAQKTFVKSSIALLELNQVCLASFPLTRCLPMRRSLTRSALFFTGGARRAHGDGQLLRHTRGRERQLEISNRQGSGQRGPRLAAEPTPSLP